MNKGYAICFNEWALDEKIKNELRLLLIISSLTAKDGYCFASNKYLAELFAETEQTISKKIKNLENYGYIEIEYEKRGWEITNRKIRLTKILMDDYGFCSVYDVFAFWGIEYLFYCFELSVVPFPEVFVLVFYTLYFIFFWEIGERYFPPFAYCGIVILNVF